MTGTADTEAEEFAKIYKLDVMVIPTNRVAAPHRRARHRLPDRAGEVRRDRRRNHREAAEGPAGAGRHDLDREVREALEAAQARGVKHVVLNAKYHEQEAEIVAQAGRKGTVTIATNMAGRGTDILLGGNPEFMARQQTLGDEVAERLPKGEEKFVDDDEFVYFYHIDDFYRVPRQAYERIFAAFKPQTDAEHDEVVGLGGLHIIGTERHEARRIDNQLRGRAGRQGDPGSSRFYLSLEDDLMRIFGSDRISGPDAAPRHGRRRADRARMVTKRHRARAEAGRSAELLGPQTPARVRRRHEQAARERLRAAPRDARGQDAAHRGRVVDLRGYLMTLAEELLESTIDRYAGEDVDPKEIATMAP